MQNTMLNPGRPDPRMMTMNAPGMVPQQPQHPMWWGGDMNWQAGHPWGQPGHSWGSGQRVFGLGGWR